MILCGIALSALAATAQLAPGQVTVKVVYVFTGAVSTPNNIAEVSPGRFIGSTLQTSTAGGGAIYSATSAGAFTVIYQFPPSPAAFEVGTIIPTVNGELFGEGHPTGSQNFFTMTRKGTNLKIYQLGSNETTLDYYPFFVPSPSGDLYAPMIVTSTQYQIARIAFDGTIAVLHTFAPSEGVPEHYGGIARGPEGNFYGINDININGVPSIYLYKLSPDGTFTKLVTFTTGGPGLPLVAAPDGTVYGARAAGGPYLTGSIYKVSPKTGQFTTLANFPKTGMSGPATLLLADDGNLYGSTFSLPSYFFRLNLTTNQLQDLAGALYSESCPCPMIQGSDGQIYGVSPAGGSGGGGLLFAIDAGLPPPKPMIELFSPSHGSAGARVELWGANLLGATSVTFNGTAASGVLTTTSQSAFVRIPTGATSGPITITTPNGSFTTQQSFTVQ